MTDQRIIASLASTVALIAALTGCTSASHTSAGGAQCPVETVTKSWGGVVVEEVCGGAGVEASATPVVAAPPSTSSTAAPPSTAYPSGSTPAIDDGQAPWAGAAVSPPAGLAGVVSDWSYRTSAFDGCSLYAVTDGGLLGEEAPTTSFGGSDKVVGFIESYDNATVTIWPPESHGYVTQMLTPAPPSRLSDGTQIRTVQIDSTFDGAPVGGVVLGIPGQPCLVEIAGEDEADHMAAVNSLRRISGQRWRPRTTVAR